MRIILNFIYSVDVLDFKQKLNRAQEKVYIIVNGNLYLKKKYSQQKYYFL